MHVRVRVHGCPHAHARVCMRARARIRGYRGAGGVAVRGGCDGLQQQNAVRPLTSSFDVTAPIRNPTPR
jgi:hypothetical protein